MHRREALKKAALFLGGTLSTQTLLALSRWDVDDTQIAFKVPTDGTVFSLTEAQRQVLAEVAEMILPKTDTPGAKDAGAPAFVEMMIKDCYQSADQNSFVEGLAALEKANFLNQNNAERTAILKKLEADTKALPQSRVAPFWRLVKDLTLLGYYSSEVGIKASFIYEPIPTKLEVIKIKPNQKAFAY